MDACMVFQIAALSKANRKLAVTHVIRMVCFPLNLREWATVIPEPGAKDFFKHILIHVLQPC